MSWWVIFTAMVGGVYTVFGAFALWIWIETRSKLAVLHGGIAALNFIYCGACIFSNSGTYSPLKLQIGMPLIFFCGSFSVYLYFLALPYYFGWNQRVIQVLQKTMLVGSLFGTAVFLYPLITGDFSLTYQPVDQTYSNPHMMSLFGPWEGTAFALFTLSIGGLTSITGNIYLFIRVFKEKRHETLVLMGIVATLLSVLNDNLLGSGIALSIVPLSFVGFIFECYRFHIALFYSYYDQAQTLTKEVARMADLSEAGRVSKQLTHDLRGLLNRAFDLIPLNRQESEARGLREGVFNILNLYSERSAGPKTDDLSDNKMPLEGHLKFVRKVYKSELEQADIRFDIKCDSDICIPLSQAESLVVFGNLIRNSIQAIKNLESEKWICAELIYEPKATKILFSDAGSGIPDHIRNRIFDTQFSTKSNGLGLGLNIVREILMDKGALIKLRRDLPQTCFEILWISDIKAK